MNILLAVPEVEQLPHEQLLAWDYLNWYRWCSHFYVVFFLNVQSSLKKKHFFFLSQQSHYETMGCKRTKFCRTRPKQNSRKTTLSAVLFPIYNKNCMKGLILQDKCWFWKSVSFWYSSLQYLLIYGVLQWFHYFLQLIIAHHFRCFCLLYVNDLSHRLSKFLKLYQTVY